MNNSTKHSKWALIVPAVLVVGFLAIDKFAPPPNYAGSTTLSWTAPTENENNDPLSALAGYVIHCWNEAGEFTKDVIVEDTDATTVKLENLPSGVLYCGITAVNTDGGESVLSNVVAKKIP
jgi:hypothetical protein